MSWGSQSWDSLDDFGGNEKTASNDGPRTFYMPQGVTKRIIFLDSAPFTFWQHSLYEVTRNAKDKEICLKKNRIGQECPICDKEMWASMIGYFTVIDMGDVKRGQGGEITLEGWTSDKGVVYQFGKKLLGAKRGGKDKPGILKKIARLAERHGDLTGCVFDVYRSGGKVESCGDEWDFVEKIAPDKIADYLLANGAEDTHVEDLTPYNYSEVFVPKSVDELKALVGGGGGGSPSTPSWGGASPSGSSDWNKWG